MAQKIREATDDYHGWLREQCEVDEPALQLKMTGNMRESAFTFLRATYFRWAQTIGDTCPELQAAPRVLAIGDIHVENYGTWRDGDGRLVWGINDFDEAAEMPYAYDLVRLAVSAALAKEFEVGLRGAATAVLAGYRQGLKEPRAALPHETAIPLRKFVNPAADDLAKFWKKAAEYPRPQDDPRLPAMPQALIAELEQMMPKHTTRLRFCRKTSGGGSLGRPRFVAIGTWHWGQVIREAKALVPSAWGWAHPGEAGPSRAIEAAYGTSRSPDPCLHVKAGYIVRRLAADSRKLDAEDIAKAGIALDVLRAMGADLAAVHSDSRSTAALWSDLDDRGPEWLQLACTQAVAQVRKDFTAFAKT